MASHRILPALQALGMAAESDVELDCSRRLSRAVDLEPPPLAQLADIIRGALEAAFAQVTVEIVECPGLWLAAKAAANTPKIADLSLQPYGLIGEHFVRQIGVRPAKQHQKCAL